MPLFAAAVLCQAVRLMQLWVMQPCVYADQRRAAAAAAAAGVAAATAVLDSCQAMVGWRLIRVGLWL